MPTATSDSPPRHISRLDVVRALAFLAVYAFHFTGDFSRTKVPWHGAFRDYSIWPRELLFLVPITFGWLGVTLFFVLSGFCIHYATLGRTVKPVTRDFYWRRFLRIYPAYFAGVVVFSLLSPWLPNKYFNFWQVLAHLAMVHNFLKATFFGINGSYWSLAVESQFYLLYPLLLYLIGRKFNLHKCLATALVLNVACQIYFSFKSDSSNPVHATWGFSLVTWCDWILGACLAEAYVKKRPLFPRGMLWMIGSGAMLLVALQIKPLNVQGYLFGSVFFAVLLQGYLSVTTPLRRVERLLVPVGVISYSLYLWHEPIILLVNRWWKEHYPSGTPWHHALFDGLVATSILVPVACASYYFLEVRAPAAIRDFLTRRKLTAKAVPLPGTVTDSPVRDL